MPGAGVAGFGPARLFATIVASSLTDAAPAGGHHGENMQVSVPVTLSFQLLIAALAFSAGLATIASGEEMRALFRHPAGSEL